MSVVVVTLDRRDGWVVRERAVDPVIERRLRLLDRRRLAVSDVVPELLADGSAFGGRLVTTVVIVAVGARSPPLRRGSLAGGSTTRTPLSRP